VNASGRVLTVFEHKRGAPSNTTSYPWFSRSRRFDDLVAQSLIIPEHTPGRHTPAECRCGEDQWHTGLKQGRSAAGMPQIDFYRCTPGRWVKPVSDGGNVYIDDPADVLWVMIDLYGRTAAEAFPGSHTAAEWHTTSYDDLALALWEAYEAALSDSGRASHDGEEVGRLLEAVVYS
jgi:hypothetical protein